MLKEFGKENMLQKNMESIMKFEEELQIQKK